MKFLHLIARTVCLLGFFSHLQASPAFDAARSLFEQHHFREAETALREVIKAEPTNAAACHTLAGAIVGRINFEKPAKEEAEPALKDAAQWLARATELEPTNAAYLRDFGMGQITGITTLKKGRKIMEQALVLDPKDPDAHAFLAVIYENAPWVLGGDKEKAAEHRQALSELNPNWLAIDEMNRLLWVDKNYPVAFARSEALLKKDPDSALGHYFLGYAASVAKTNLERGLASLKKALALPPLKPIGNSVYNEPFPVSPSYIWEKIGEIEGQLGHAETSRAAYLKAVELDPANYWAVQAVQKTNPERTKP